MMNLSYKTIQIHLSKLEKKMLYTIIKTLSLSLSLSLSLTHGQMQFKNCILQNYCFPSLVSVSCPSNHHIVGSVSPSSPIQHIKETLLICGTKFIENLILVVSQSNMLYVKKLKVQCILPYLHQI